MTPSFPALEVRFAERVAKVRQFRGLSQQELAAAVGLGRTTIADIETGKRHVRLIEAVHIAEALGVSLPDLYGDRPLIVAPAPVRVD